MIHGWIIGGLAALDPDIENAIESEEDDTFPRGLPSAKGLTKVCKNHNAGFPFGFMKERPELVKGIPLIVISTMAGALCALLQDRGKTAQKAGITIIIGGALSNLYDRVVRGYVADYFSIEWEPIRGVVFSLGDMFVFLGSTIIMLGQTTRSLAEVRKKKWVRKMDKKYKEK